MTMHQKVNVPKKKLFAQKGNFGERKEKV